mmetsp:Transcript_67483/g.188297  ORF Transcript_67483/g.188297 Transcript_67483/m.188297 type:complete len:516 (+) Transcript_67483:33-1580(+)
MVVLSAAIVTSGKTLIARQFVEMTRLRVEGLLSAFPKLVDSGRDHTFIETETVRYVYQPMEALYLVLVTNKSSNILEDLETLRVLAKVVQDCCQIQVNEEQVLKNAFDIIFAFDEVISFGHRESVTLAQIKTYTEMDSHEEKVHQMIEQSKINEAREMAKKKQMELTKLRATQGNNTDNSSAGRKAMESLSASNFSEPAPAMTMRDPSSPPAWSAQMDSDSGPVIKPGAPKKGMLLSKKKPGDFFGDPAPAFGESAAAAAPEEEAAPAVVNPLLDPVKVDIEEKVVAELDVEGSLSGDASCQGELRVTVLDTAKADLVCFKLAPQDQEFKYKVHPNLNKASHQSNILEVRDKQRAFPANSPLPLVKWQAKSSDESFLPVTLACWPTPMSDGTQVVLELELTDSSVVLEDVHVRFPMPPTARPNVSSADIGEAGYDQGSGELHWFIPRLENAEGQRNLEFKAACDSASMLPFTFEGTRRGQTKCRMEILECYHQERKDVISYACEKSCIYLIKCGV